MELCTILAISTCSEPNAAIQEKHSKLVTVDIDQQIILLGIVGIYLLFWPIVILGLRSMRGIREIRG